MKIVTAYDLGAETARKHIAQTKTAFELGTGSALFKSAAPEPPTPPQTVPRENVTYDDDTTYPGYKIRRTTTQAAPKLPAPPAPKLPEPPAAHPQEQVTYDDNDTIPGYKIKRTITRPVPKPVPPAAPPSTSSPAV